MNVAPDGKTFVTPAAGVSPGPALAITSVQVTVPPAWAGDGAHRSVDGERSGASIRTTAVR